MAGPLILMAVGVFMVNLSWRKWPDVLIDFGRELYVPWQISQGSVLYRDITHLYGPFSHYFNSWLFDIFGVHLMTLAVFNIGLIVALTYIIYRIFLELTDSLSATVAGAVFLSIFAFSQYIRIANYNFVCPYSHEVTHGILLSFLSILSLVMYLRRRRALWMVLIGVCIGLVSLTKVEIFLAISSVMFCGLFSLTIIERPKLFDALKVPGLFSLGFFFPILGFLMYFSTQMPVEKAMESITFQYRVLLESDMPFNIFYHRLTGMDDPSYHINKLFTVTGWYLMLVLFFMMLGYTLDRLADKRNKWVTISLIIGTVLIANQLVVKQMPLMDMTRPLPLMMLLFGIYHCGTLFRFSKDSQKTNHSLPMLVLTVFAFLLLLKIILNVHVFHYGFALSLPATLLLIVIMLYYLPKGLGKVTSHTCLVRTLCLILVGVTVVSHVRLSKQRYDLKNYVVGSGNDTILAMGPKQSNRGIFTSLALKKIKAVVHPDQSFVALPEGVILNYLARRKNPGPYFEFTPPIVEMLGEKKIIDSFEKKWPDYIVLTHKDTSEHGYRFFGRDYGGAIFSWIKKNYAPVFHIGNAPLSGMGFGIVIAQRVAG